MEKLQGEIKEAQAQLVDYDKAQAEYDEAQKAIADLEKQLTEYRDTSMVSDAEVEQLKQDVDFYKQES